MSADSIESICSHFLKWGDKEAHTANRSLYIHEDTLRTGHKILYSGSVVAARYENKNLPTSITINIDGFPAVTVGRMILVEQGKLPASTIKVRHSLLKRGTAIGRDVYPVHDAAHPKKAYTHKVDERHEELERLRLSRSSRSRVNSVERIHEAVKCIRGMEVFFNIKPTKLEIPDELVPKLCMWRMDGEPIMENWKNLLEKLNGTTKNNYKAA